METNSFLDDNAIDKSMHVTWLVSDPAMFFQRPEPTSSLDRVLPFGLTRPEWIDLFFVILGIEPEQLTLEKETGMQIVEFDQAIPNYPMLSRIRGVYYDTEFRDHEVQLLEQECLRLLPNVSSPLASRGLQKLLAIAAEAKKLGLSIYLLCD